MIRTALALMLLPLPALADGLKIENPMVPLAPPAAKVHAAYMTLTNPGQTTQQVIGIKAEGYAMSHLHKSEIRDGVATMSPIDMIELAPGQTVTLHNGGLHVMLMKPKAAKAEGDKVSLTLEFADGTSQQVTAMVMRQQAGDHKAHSGHGS